MTNLESNKLELNKLELNKLEPNKKVVGYFIEAECSSDWRPRHAASLSNVRL